MKKIIITIFTLILATVNFATAENSKVKITNDEYSAKVFKLINQRLEYMKDVALYKAQNHLPIEDLKRETVVIDKAAESAEDKGLKPETIKEFFSSQISAAKAIQFRYFADWQTDDISKKTAIDLKDTIRPELLTLGNQIIDAIFEKIQNSGNFDKKQWEQFDKSVTIDNLKENDKKQLFNALLKIRIMVQ